jgi:O-antigen/teichoic acid export membrane protein
VIAGSRPNAAGTTTVLSEDAGDDTRLDARLDVPDEAPSGAIGASDAPARGERPTRIRDILERVRQRFAGEGTGGTMARGALWSFGINVASMALGLGVQVLLARTLGKENYGLYIYALAWMNVALLAAKLEFDTNAMRFIGAYTGTGNWSMLRGFLQRSRQVVGFASIAVAVSCAAAVWLFRASLRPELAASYLFACALLVVTALIQLEAASLQAFRRVLAAQLPNMIVRPILFAGAMAISTYVLGIRLGAPHAVAMNLAATIVALALTIRYRRAATPPEVSRSKPTYQTGVWVHASGGFLLINTAQLVLSSQSDVLVVGTLLGTSEAGLYGVASQLANLIGFGVVALMFVVAPMISNLHAAKRHADLQRLVTMTVRASAAVSLPVLLGLLLLGRFVLGWFGPTFVNAYPILLILSVGAIIASIVGLLAGFIMTMTGHQYQAGVIISITAGLNLLLSFVLTPRFGALGAATATAIATVARTGVLSVYIWRKLRIRVLPH